MILKRREKGTQPLVDILVLKNGGLSPVEKLRAIASYIRPKNAYDIKDAESRLLDLIVLLESNSVAHLAFKRLVFCVFLTSNITDAMANSGMAESDSVVYEFMRRVGHKIIPPLKDKKSVGWQISNIFNKSNDFVWVKGVDTSLWGRLFYSLNLTIDIRSYKLQEQLCNSLVVLSYRLVALGLEKSIVERLADNGGLNSSFVAQRKLVDEFLEAQHTDNVSNEVVKLIGALEMCAEGLDRVKAGNVILGTSMRETHLLERMSTIIHRMRVLVSLLSNDNRMEIPALVNFFRMVVENEITQNSIRSYLSVTSKDLAFQISEAGMNTGEHYITSTAKEYWHMFTSALKGGAFVSGIALLKSLLHHLMLAPFWEAFSYGVNYAVGFVTLQANGGTLATKQPAMTASAVAGALDSRSGENNMAELAITLSKVLRSQLASLMGNVLAVFPAAMVIAFVWNLVFGQNLVEGVTAQSYLDQQNPLSSLCWLYAAIAGVFLFLSGIISGYFENYIVHGKIAQRLREHPAYSGKVINRFAGYLERNIGMLAGNISLGFFLGFAAFFGDIFGLPFDIRHVTFATANIAFGLVGLGFNVPVSEFLWLIVGIILIGLFNLLVSFSLAFYVAMKSRGVTFRDYRTLVLHLKRLLLRHPLDFVFPPKSDRNAKDLE